MGDGVLDLFSAGERDALTSPLRIGASPVEQEALRLWRERERRWPKFVQRQHPDGLDAVTGVWARMLAEAEHGIGQALASRPVLSHGRG